MISLCELRELRRKFFGPGGKATLAKYGREHFSKLGKTTLERHGREHFAKIGKKGAEARWYLKRKRGYRGWKEANGK